MENKELLKKAKRANSPEELLTIAKENEIELDEEGAKAYFEQFHKSGELSDDELDNVAGGGCYHNDQLVVTNLYKCDHFEYNTKGSGMAGEKGCINCKNVTYKNSLMGSLLLCTHPDNNKK